MEYGACNTAPLSCSKQNPLAANHIFERVTWACEASGNKTRRKRGAHVILCPSYPVNANNYVALFHHLEIGQDAPRPE